MNTSVHGETCEMTARLFAESNIWSLQYTEFRAIYSAQCMFWQGKWALSTLECVWYHDHALCCVVYASHALSSVCHAQHMLMQEYAMLVLH